MTENEVTEIPVEQAEEVQQVEQQPELSPEEQKAIWQRAKAEAQRVLAEAYAKERR